MEGCSWSTGLLIHAREKIAALQHHSLIHMQEEHEELSSSWELQDPLLLQPETDKARQGLRGSCTDSEQLQNEGCQYCTWLSSFQQHRTALAAGEGTQSLGVLDVRAQILTDLSAWWGSLAREEEELELQTIPGSQREFRLWQAHGFVLRWHRSHLWDVGLVLAATAGCGRWHPQTG